MGISYPASVWDGDSGSRDSDDGNQRGPDYRDWDRMIGEIAAAQKQLGVGADADAVAAVGTVGTGVTEVSDRAGIQKTVLTLGSLAINCAEGSTKEYGSQKIFTFPQGAIKILGLTANLDLASSDYSSAEEGDFALGKIAATDRALTGDDVTFLAATALTFGSGTAALHAQGDIVTLYDGTGTAAPVFLNIAMDQGGGVGDVVVTGTITILWCNVGDY